MIDGTEKDRRNHPTLGNFKKNRNAGAVWEWRRELREMPGDSLSFSHSFPARGQDTQPNKGKWGDGVARSRLCLENPGDLVMESQDRVPHKSHFIFIGFAVMESQDRDFV